MGVRQGLSDPGPQAGRAGWFHLEAVVMVAPVVYLVAAALLVGLILFLTRSRSRMVAGRRCRHAMAGEAARSLTPEPL